MSRQNIMSPCQGFSAAPLIAIAFVRPRWRSFCRVLYLGRNSFTRPIRWPVVGLHSEARSAWSACWAVASSELRPHPLPSHFAVHVPVIFPRFVALSPHGRSGAISTVAAILPPRAAVRLQCPCPFPLTSCASGSRS